MQIYISKQEENIFTFSYITQQDFFAHTLKAPKYLQVSDNELFRLALITNPFDEKVVEILGLSVNQILINDLSKILNQSLICNYYVSEEDFVNLSTIGSEEVFLGFSGGFDSMAAQAILPKAKNVSIDFGGAFEREREFFSTLTTDIVSWDLRNKRENFLSKFNEGKNWRFMLAPLTLFKEKRSSIAIATGTIMEASPYWMEVGNKSELSSYSHSGYGKGISLFNPVAGLTEVTTTSIVSRFYGNEIAEKSLKSLAAPTTFKFQRKKFLLALVDNEIYVPNIKYRFGSALTDDFLTLYVRWKLGDKWVRENYALNLPDDIPDIDMSFCEKVNTDNMLHIDLNFREKILENIENFNIERYTQDDYVNLRLVNQYLFKK